MELLVVGIVIGFLVGHVLNMHERWRIEDERDAQRERADELTRELIVAYQRAGMAQQKPRGDRGCSNERADLFKTW